MTGSLSDITRKCSCLLWANNASIHFPVSQWGFVIPRVWLGKKANPSPKEHTNPPQNDQSVCNSVILSKQDQQHTLSISDQKRTVPFSEKE